MTTKTNKFFASIIITISFLLLTGCNTLQRIENSELTSDFDQIFDAYSKNLRWSHYKQITVFMTDEQIAPSLDKIKSLKGRRVSDVKPIAWALDDQTQVMTGDVVIDYYIVDRGVIRTTTQHQTWRYIGDTWRLDSGLPDLP